MNLGLHGCLYLKGFVSSWGLGCRCQQPALVGTVSSFLHCTQILCFGVSLQGCLPALCREGVFFPFLTSSFSKPPMKGQQA